MRAEWRIPAFRWAALALALGMLSSLLSFAFWRPAHLERVKSEQELARLESLVRQAMRGADSRARAAKDKAYLASQWAKAGILLSQSDQAALIGQAASKGRLSLLSAEFSPPERQAAARVYKLQLRLRGPYAALRGFLSGLQDLPVLILAQDTALEQAGNGEVLADLKMESYQVARNPGDAP